MKDDDKMIWPPPIPKVYRDHRKFIYQLTVSKTLTHSDKNQEGKNLYAFWGDRLTKNVNKALEGSGSGIFVNLASNEYFSALQKDAIKGEIITPQFKDLKNGTYKFITIYGKKARGMMCDFMIQNNVNTADDLKQFDSAGYRYNKELSEGSNWVFTRDEVPAA